MDIGSKWWVTIIEGAAAILLGLYLLLGGDAAAGNVALVASLYILIMGILELWRGEGTVSRYRGIVNLIVGAVILLLYAVDIFGTQTDFTIFAIGVIIVGAMGIYGSVFARSGRKFDWGPVIANALLLLWGVLIFVFRSQELDLQRITSWILIAIGAILIIWGFLSRDDEEPEEVSLPEPPTIEDIVKDSTEE